MNEYEKQAIDFLKETGTAFEIIYQYTGPHFSGETDHRDVYRFTLKNSKGEYSSTFGDSIRNTERRELATRKPLRNTDIYGATRTKALRAGLLDKDGRLSTSALLKARNYKPSAYDILSCLEKYCPDTFEEFCDDYGYNDLPLTEYSRIMQIFQNCKDQERALKKLFTPEQMEKLADIN